MTGCCIESKCVIITGAHTLLLAPLPDIPHQELRTWNSNCEVGRSVLTCNGRAAWYLIFSRAGRTTSPRRLTPALPSYMIVAVALKKLTRNTKEKKRNCLRLKNPRSYWEEGEDVQNNYTIPFPNWNDFVLSNEKLSGGDQKAKSRTANMSGALHASKRIWEKTEKTARQR